MPLFPIFFSLLNKNFSKIKKIILYKRGQRWDRHFLCILKMIVKNFYFIREKIDKMEKKFISMRSAAYTFHGFPGASYDFFLSNMLLSRFKQAQDFWV